MNSVLATVTIRGYLKLRYPDCAEKFFLSLSPEISAVPNTINCLMMYFYHRFYYQKVIKYLKFANDHRVKIDFYSYLIAIRAIIILGNYEYAQTIIDRTADYFPKKMSAHLDTIRKDLLLVGDKEKVEWALSNVKKRFRLLKTYNDNPLYE